MSAIAKPQQRALRFVGATRTRARSTLAVASALIAACASPTASGEPRTAGGQEPMAAARPAPSSYAGYPNSLAVVGHSQATGENTVPYERGDTKSNTWASGTNPAVRSVYLRILAENPEIAGHVTNAAQAGAPIAAIEQQAISVAGTHPDLLLVQAIDGDLACPATATDVRNYGQAVASLLDNVAEISPTTRVFMVTQLGSPRTYVESLTTAQRLELGAMMGGPGPCAFVDAQGRLVAKEVNRLERIIRDYERIQAKVCDEHDNCDHDGGNFSEAVELPGDFTEDLNHWSIQGHTRAAELAWMALQDAGLIPRR